MKMRSWSSPWRNAVVTSIECRIMPRRPTKSKNTRTTGGVAVGEEELDPKYPFAFDHVVVERAGYVDEGAVADKGLVLFEDCLAPMRVVGACHSFVIISRLEDDGRTGEDQYWSAGHAEGDCLGVGEEVEAKKFTMGVFDEEGRERRRKGGWCCKSAALLRGEAATLRLCDSAARLLDRGNCCGGS
ncbi:hypothetical protein CLOP_g22848 [Closterium sp. NIES-67]|nr:hypothetical protein CLOP_g22848 [Closterium sp. NIES-67]